MILDTKSDSAAGEKLPAGAVVVVAGGAAVVVAGGAVVVGAGAAVVVVAGFGLVVVVGTVVEGAAVVVVTDEVGVVSAAVVVVVVGSATGSANAVGDLSARVESKNSVWNSTTRPSIAYSGGGAMLPVTSWMTATQPVAAIVNASALLIFPPHGVSDPVRVSAITEVT
ncbi:MAG TPA: hypothetical protein VFT54_10320 [Acidimicrobiia bacterium]|nr:hypothetical protein [Acidimicrobiia bacterium]